jgi:hypothetical protein
VKDHKPSPLRVDDARAVSAQYVAQRLDRLMRWAQLSLLRLARAILEIADAWAPLDHAATRALTPKIARLEKIMLALIMLKGGLRAKPPRRERRFGPKRRSGHNARRLFGARLRKSVKARDLRAKIAALLALAHDPEAHVADAARRLSRGFTRWYGGVPRLAFVAQALCFAAASLDAANTS